MTTKENYMGQATINAVPREYSADEVADCLLSIADEQILGKDPEGNEIREGITNLKLQKMLYFADAVHLALFDKQLFADEIQAWDLGPVIPKVYFRFSKDYGNNPIHADASNGCTDKELMDFLREVWNIFGKYSASELVNLSHRHLPWKKRYKEGVKDIIIPKDEIATFYKDLFKLKDGKSSQEATMG